MNDAVISTPGIVMIGAERTATRSTGMTAASPCKERIFPVTGSRHGMPQLCSPSISTPAVNAVIQLKPGVKVPLTRSGAEISRVSGSGRTGRAGSQGAWRISIRAHPTSVLPSIPCPACRHSSTTGPARIVHLPFKHTMPAPADNGPNSPPLDPRGCALFCPAKRSPLEGPGTAGDRRRISPRSALPFVHPARRSA